MIVHYMNAADTTQFVAEQSEFFNEVLASMQLD